MKSINAQPSEKSIYIWNIIGSMANALLSVIILMLVTRMLDNKQADIFSIAWTISQLMATIGTFQIRTYQATDVEEKFKFHQYLIFRIVTVGIMMLSSILYVVVKSYTIYKATIVFIVCLFRGVDSLADVYEGWFQQKERLDLAGKAITYRIVFAMAGFGTTLYITNNLLFSCSILLFCYILCFLFINVRYCYIVDKLKKRKGWTHHTHWIVKLAAEGAPLFVNAFLMMSICNEPKMVIDSAIEQNKMMQGTQTIFNVLFLPASVLTLAYIVFRPLLTQMAVLWNRGEIKPFLKIIIRILACLLGMAILLLVGSTILGIPILSFIYDIDLSQYKWHLSVIIIGGCFCTFSYVFDNALVVIRKQYFLVCSYIVTWIYVKLISVKMVVMWGIMGAALSYATAMFVFFFTTMIIFIICLKISCKSKDTCKIGE